MISPVLGFGHFAQIALILCTQHILLACAFGRISTLAAATLRELGYTKAALDGGIKARRESSLPMTVL